MESNNDVVINDTIIDKLDSMSNDIKMYVNMNAHIGSNLRKVLADNSTFMDEKELNEILEIRLRIKNLSHKLRNKISK